MQTEPLKVHSIVLYDGLCGLCDGVVQFLLRRDKKDIFRFAAQQSEFAQEILRRHGLTSASAGAANSDTICVVEGYGSPAEHVFIKSEATLRITRRLGGLWRVAGVLVGILPRRLADRCYDMVARNRFRIFGRREQCRVPGAGDRQKFLGLVSQTLARDCHSERSEESL